MPILTKDQILKAVMELEVGERDEVLTQLNAQYLPPPLSPEQERELDEALREHEDNPSTARPWNEFYAELREKR